MWCSCKHTLVRAYTHTHTHTHTQHFMSLIPQSSYSSSTTTDIHTIHDPHILNHSIIYVYQGMIRHVPTKTNTTKTQHTQSATATEIIVTCIPSFPQPQPTLATTHTPTLMWVPRYTKPTPNQYISSYETCTCALALCVCVLDAQSCPTLSDPMDCSLPGSSVHEILQARILEWIASSKRQPYQTLLFLCEKSSSKL